MTKKYFQKRFFRVRHIKAKKILLLIFFVGVLCAAAQNKSGITGKVDTSYSTYSAWLQTRQANPAIKIVPEYKSPNVIEKKNITYCMVDSRQLQLDVFSPKAKTASNGIAVIILHGGGWRSGNRMQHYPLAQNLAALGYTCFTPEYRLSTEALFPA